MGSTLLAHTGTRCSISALALNLSRLIRTRHHLSHRRGDELILNWNGSWNVSENPEDLVCVSITHCPWYSGKLRERFGGGEFLEFLSVMFIWTHQVAAMQFELPVGAWDHMADLWLSALHFSPNQPKTLREWSKKNVLHQKKNLIMFF